MILMDLSMLFMHIRTQGRHNANANASAKKPLPSKTAQELSHALVLKSEEQNPLRILVRERLACCGR
jgi:hypothetical protein